MHNIKDIRKNYDHFAKSLEKRFLTIDIDKIKDLDEKNRALIQKKRKFRTRKKRNI